MAPPDIALAAGLSDVADADALALPVRGGDGGPSVAEGAAEVEARFGVSVADELGHLKAKGEVGEVHEVPVAAEGDAAEVLLLVGVGDASVRSMRRAAAALARKAQGRRRIALLLPAGADGEALRAVAEGLVLGSYRFTRRSSPKGPAPLEGATLVVSEPEGQQPALDEALAVAGATWQARDLANTPSNEKDPAWLAEQARALAGTAGLDVRIWDEDALAAEGFGGILAVGAGSSRPPRLIRLDYVPEGGEAAARVVLVGKGITFDSGGLSLKPNDAMVPMKTDMAAGGAVLAVMGALRELGIHARVTGLVAAAENLPSGSASRPGDVITHYGGTTVEVFNTDAEGRLVLADALAYADTQLQPDVLVDLATLTGAASLGLGRRHAALYTADDALARDFCAAGEESGDRVWRMPLVDDYRFALDSAVADLSNISRNDKISGGSITAALFLREFVGGRRWVHLDIAGPARAESDEHEVTKGATGFGARLLLRWLESSYGRSGR
ncbi:MAG: leucyl aminopeptidase [Actinomycetota bacterium]|nr:leucyl aminopeptidase [Actinomycetota bacterium]